MASNLSLGTYVQDGLRSGPLYSGSLFSSPAAGIYLSPNYDRYGPGIFYSPQNTWNIVPNAGALDNLVVTSLAGGVTGAQYLTLAGDNAATTLYQGVVYFDWPRVPTVTIAGANATNATRVTIFGTDWYNQPLQHTYVLAAAQATYPTITLGVGGVAGTITVPAAVKAFYTVTGVYISAALPALATISLGVSNVFGLPYLCNNLGDVTSIGWDASSDFTGAAVAGDSILPKGVFVEADQTNPSTASTGDTRGLYGPSTAPNGVRCLRFTQYVMGADVWLNQLSNNQQIAVLNGYPQIGVAIPPLNVTNLYGQQQFFTNLPS